MRAIYTKSVAKTCLKIAAIKWRAHQPDITGFNNQAIAC